MTRNRKVSPWEGWGEVAWGGKKDRLGDVCTLTVLASLMRYTTPCLMRFRPYDLGE